MARSLSNNFALRVAIETALGVASVTGGRAGDIDLLEPNKRNGFGAKITKMSRNPIAKDRNRRKGAVVDLDSTVAFEHDLTMDIIRMFTNAFLMSNYTAVGGGLANGAPFRPTAVTATGFTVPAGGAIPDGTLFVVKGSAVAGNNGLKVAAGTSVALEIKCAGLTPEAAPPSNMTLEICGFQFTAGDLTSTASTLVSAAVTMTDLGLTVGQWVFVGGATGGALVYDTAANRGPVRLSAITATTLSFEHAIAAFGVDAGAAKTIQVFFGPFCRNVSVDAATWLERSFTFEGEYEDLNAAGVDEYKYPVGNYCAEFVHNIPVTSKATAELSFIGTNTANPTTVRATGFSTSRSAVNVEPFNTSSDVLRMRLCTTAGVNASSSFKNLKLTLKNNVSPEKIIGTLGAAYMNFGRFEVNFDAQVLLESSTLITACRSNTTIGLEYGLRNPDGGFMVDIPALTLQTADDDLPENETIRLDCPGEAHKDPTLGYSISVSQFPYLPAA